MSLLEKTIDGIAPQDQASRDKAKERLDALTMPHWALGKLMDLALDLAGMTRSVKPKFSGRAVVTMAGDHGVVSEGISKYPQEVTPQMVYNFVNGGAGINAMARNSGASVYVVDMGVASPLDELVKGSKIIDKRVASGTANIAKGPAMSREQAIKAVEGGIEVAMLLAPGVDIFGVGEMGIGNTTPSSAIVSVMTGLAPEEVTGRGTGIDDEQLKHKVGVIARAIDVNKPDANDGLDVLAKIGGFEIGGIAGLILGAASLRKPVIIDGFISTAGAMIAHALCPTVADYIISAHKSVEQGHVAMLKKLGKEPLLDLDFRLGEGTGAALAMHLVDASVRILTEVATFEEAAVSGASS
ncbi:MAG: nicotinate-nucleotide--dimethylbenzimidazole phosphoribosyltransferase [Planctomycetes bacterium]|nr:nicotinate-nucleotide--dimethylbenzimidazole phosphoribosyltransferase [Planctomycetota bacterium]